MSTSEVRAYALREDQQDFSGGSVALDPDGNAFNVGEALEEQGGTIVTDDPRVIAALAEFPAVKSVSVPDDRRDALDAQRARDQERAEAAGEPTDPEAHSRDELRELAEQVGADVGASATKVEIAQAIDAAKNDGGDE